jgi:Uncharacterized conserved protein (DUF2190)
VTSFGGDGYSPLYLPGDQISLTVADAVTAGDFLAVAGSGLVAPVTAAGQQWVGIAGFAAVPGDRVAVYGRGPVHVHLADGPVTAGTLLAPSGTAGRVTVAAEDASPAATCGIALTSAADAVPVTWMAI